MYQKQLRGEETHMKTAISWCVVTSLVAALALGSARTLLAAEAAQRNDPQALFHAAQTDWSRQKWNDAIAKFKQTAEQLPGDPVGLDAQCHYAECLSYVTPPETAIA